jgi:hypothetical protein
MTHSRHSPAPLANRQDADHAEQSSHNRAELARAMGKPKEVHALNHARAEESRIRDEVGAKADQRAYGSGSTNDPRGHRLLHDHFAQADQQGRPYSGPHSYHTGGNQHRGSEHRYQEHARTHYPAASDSGQAHRITHGNLHQPGWARDQKPRRT